MVRREILRRELHTARRNTPADAPPYATRAGLSLGIALEAAEAGAGKTMACAFERAHGASAHRIALCITGSPLSYSRYFWARKRGVRVNWMTALGPVTTTLSLMSV